MLQTFVIYPAADGGTKAIVGENPIFTGFEAWRGAPITAGKHPLILISHGSGGNILGLNWLTTRLASLGYIVVGPNHPGTMSGDSSEKKTIEIWHRPMDTSATLDALLADPAIAPSIDATAVGALGFSLGGYDVMALGGAEQRRKAFAIHCMQNQKEMGCAWLLKAGVDLMALDPRFDDSHRDARIKAIVAVDPGFTPSYDEDTLRAMKVPVLFINMGTPAKTPEILETHYVAGLISGAKVVRVPDAVHFSFLGLCKPDGAKFLEQIGDDPICTDAGGRDRAALHEDMLKATTAFLAEHLPVGK
jgi:predicted dienelactone hydrolase